MRNEPWIHMRFSYEISTSSVSLNLMGMSSKNFNSLKDFQSDQIKTSSRKLFTAHYACSNFEFNLTLVVGMTTGFIFQIINSLIESWGVRLTCFDCKIQVSQFQRNLNLLPAKRLCIKTISNLTHSFSNILLLNQTIVLRLDNLKNASLNLLPFTLKKQLLIFDCCFSQSNKKNKTTHNIVCSI